MLINIGLRDSCNTKVKDIKEIECKNVVWNLMDKDITSDTNG